MLVLYYIKSKLLITKMSLMITEIKGTFFLNGKINSITSEFLKNHLESLINLKKDLTINIEAVQEIDPYGVLVLKDLYIKTIKQNKRLWIIGYGSKELYLEFKFSS